VRDLRHRLASADAVFLNAARKMLQVDSGARRTGGRAEMG
jgi:hypothetical protein